MLKDSIRVATSLWAKLSSRGRDDVATFGSCCVGEVAASHVDADCVVHCGHACLSPGVLFSFFSSLESLIFSCIYLVDVIENLVFSVGIVCCLRIGSYFVWIVLVVILDLFMFGSFVNLFFFCIIFFCVETYSLL